MPSTVVNTSTAVQTGFPSPNGSLQPHVVVATVLVADVNTGYTIVPAIPGRTLRPINFFLRPNGGNTGSCTLVCIGDTADTPVVIGSVTQGAATSGALITPAGGANIVVGAGFGVPLTAGKGIQVYKTGSAADTVVSFTVVVEYLEV